MKVFLFILILLYSKKQSTANIFIPCDSSSECNSQIATSICSKIIGGYCTCPAGYTFSLDASQCLKEALYGETCFEGSQCSHMLNAKCNGNFCVCNEGFTYIRGKCRKTVNLSDPCREDIDCFFGYNRESVTCENGKCQCAEGFYQRFFNVCRRELNNGDYCIVNQDCIDDDSSCVGTSNERRCTVSVGTQTSRNASVQTTQSLESFSEVQLGKSSSIPNRIIHNYIKYNKLENDDAAKFSFDDESTQFGESCEEESRPCTGLKYSVCRRGFCQCQDGFYEQNKVCKAELGEIVEEEKYCGSGIFKNNKCVCQNNQFYHPNLRQCVKASLGIGQSCTQPSQCSPYGAAYCSIQCKCYDYATYNEATQLCELKKGIGEYCETSANCTKKDTECTDRNTCECKSNFIAQNDECKPGMFSNCEKTEDCAFENAECKVEIVDEQNFVKKCQCKEEFISVGNVCLEKAKNYNDSCSSVEQCTVLLGEKASCMENKCICNENLHFKDGKCNEKRKLDETCSKSAECFVSDPETVECRNGVCQCKFDYSKDSSQNRCRPREKNSSNAVSPLKVITLMLIGSAVVLTSSAIKDAYFP